MFVGEAMMVTVVTVVSRPPDGAVLNRHVAESTQAPHMDQNQGQNPDPVHLFFIFSVNGFHRRHAIDPSEDCANSLIFWGA